MDTLPIATPRQAGIYVRRARERQGLTRAQLAEAAGVSERLLASLELGDATGIRLDKLLAVFDALGIGLAARGDAIARAQPDIREHQAHATRSSRSDIPQNRTGGHTATHKQRMQVSRSQSSSDYDAAYRDFLRRQGINTVATSFATRR